MKEFKGSQEEWKNDGNIIFADDYFQSHIAVLPNNYNKEIINAHAKLIANAPKMLELLQELVYELAGEQECEEELDKGLGVPLATKVISAQQLLNKILD